MWPSSACLIYFWPYGDLIYSCKTKEFVMNTILFSSIWLVHMSHQTYHKDNVIRLYLIGWIMLSEHLATFDWSLCWLVMPHHLQTLHYFIGMWLDWNVMTLDKWHELSPPNEADIELKTNKMNFFNLQRPN